jgi:hypothetical protein
MTKSKSWRDVLPIHPAADLFPLMAPDELRALGEDIKKNGLKIPIVFCLADDGKGKLLLDGRNRLDAMELIGGKSVDRRDELALDPTYLHGLANDDDPYGFVISINARRRHLTAEQKRELIAKVLKAQSEKSDRQIAATVKASPTTVGTVRAKMEAKGEVSKLDTRTDAKGVKQPATKSTRAHVCWQCRRRGEIGEVQQHHYAQYEDADVWLHDACISAFDQAEQLQRAAQPPACLCPNCACSNDAPQETKAARDDIGGVSNGEIARKDARIDELQSEKRRLEIENVGLRSEVEEAKAARKPEDEGEGNELGNLLQAWDRASQSAREKFKVRVGLVAVDTPVKATDDGLDIPDWRRRAAL